MNFPENLITPDLVKLLPIMHPSLYRPEDFCEVQAFFYLREIPERKKYYKNIEQNTWFILWVITKWNRAEQYAKVRQTCQACCLSRSCVLLRQRSFSITPLLDANDSGCSKSPSSVAMLPLLFDLEKERFWKLSLVLDFWERNSPRYPSTLLSNPRGKVTFQIWKPSRKNRVEWSTKYSGIKNIMRWREAILNS